MSGRPRDSSWMAAPQNCNELWEVSAARLQQGVLDATEHRGWGREPAPDHPPSDSQHHRWRFPPGTQALSPERPLKAQSQQEMWNNHRTAAPWIIQISGKTQNTYKDPILRAQASPAGLESSMPLFLTVEKLRPGLQISVSFPSTAP